MSLNSITRILWKPGLLLTMLCGLATSLSASFVIGYDTSLLTADLVPDGAPVTSQPSFINASPISRGPGMSASGLTHSYSTNNYPLTPGSSLNDALSVGRYFEMSFGINASNVSFTSLDARIRKSASSAEFYTQWQYSLDAFSTPGIVFGGYDDSTISTGDGASQPTIDLTGESELQNLSGGTVTMRMYVWGIPASSGTSFAFGRSRQLDSQGGASLGNALEIALVPEPSYTSIALGLLTFGWLFLRRRR